MTRFSRSTCSHLNDSPSLYVVAAHVAQKGLGDVDAFRLRQIEHAVITEQKGPASLFRAVLSGRLPLVADVPEDDGRRFLAFVDSPARL
jgi:hypothetical protein